jgi:hypothetical protein
MSRLPHFLDRLQMVDRSAALCLQEDSWYSFISLRGGVDPRAIVCMEGLGQLKNSVTSSGIELATFQLVA